MSRFDVERFTTALRRDQNLEEEFLRLQDDAEGVARWAARKGFDLSPDEAEGLVSSYGELPMEDLENVAGGWDGSGGGG